MGLCPDVERPPATRRSPTRRGVTHAGAQARICFWLGVPAGPGTGNISPGGDPMRLAVHAATAVFGYFPLQLERTRGRYQTFYSKRLQLFSKHGAGRQDLATASPIPATLG